MFWLEPVTKTQKVFVCNTKSNFSFKGFSYPVGIQEMVRTCLVCWGLNTN